MTEPNNSGIQTEHAIIINIIENDQQDFLKLKFLIEHSGSNVLTQFFSAAPWTKSKIQVEWLKPEMGKDGRPDREALLRQVLISGAHLVVIDIGLDQQEEGEFKQLLKFCRTEKQFWSEGVQRTSGLWLIDKLHQFWQQRLFVPLIALYINFDQVNPKWRFAARERGAMITINKRHMGIDTLQIVLPFAAIAAVNIPDPQLPGQITYLVYKGKDKNHIWNKLYNALQE